MSDKNNFDFDLDIDSILAEFSSSGEPEPTQDTGPAPAEAPRSTQSEPVSGAVSPVPAQSRAPAKTAFQPCSTAPRQYSAPEGTQKPAPRRSTPQEDTRRQSGQNSESQSRSQPRSAASGVSQPKAFDPERLGYPARRSTAQAETGRARRMPDTRTEPEQAPLSKAGLALRNIIGAVFALISLFSLCWIFINIHPDSGTVSAAKESKLDLVAKLDSYVNNAASDALGDLTYIKKIYTIPESDTVAPRPDSAKYGSTTNPADIQAVIDSASALLEGQELAWDPNVDFVPNTSIQYYLDDTILVITWQENIEGKCVTCSEVKIANGSQLRRKIAGDTYSTGIRYYATDMAKECNAVVAINGDFYDFRTIGVTVYQRQLYRFVPDKLDSCHFTSSGDMLFSYSGELTDEASTQQFVNDNDVIFTLSFGPVLVDNGELKTISSYPIGEIERTYSRSAIGQLDSLHYFLITVNYGDGFTVAATVNQMGQFIYSKGVQKAYELDGGQTSLIIMNGETVNHVDFGYERTMSDIIYFATAIPEQEAAQ